MPIYEQTYRRYEARRPLRRARFVPITREALKLLLARKAFLVLLFVAWIPVVAWAIWVWFTTQFAQAGNVLPVSGRLFGEFLNRQIVFTLLLSIFGGAGLVANDLRTGAILVYLSRPLTRRDYVLGKVGVLLVLNLAITLVPGLLLYGVGLALAPEQLLKWDLAWIGPAIVLHSFVLAAVVSLVALAISALSRSARVAGLAFFGLMMALNLVLLIVRRIADTPAVLLLSIWGNLDAVGNALFGVPTSGERLAWPYPAAALALVCLGCLAILRSRVRAVEIVR